MCLEFDTIVLYRKIDKEGEEERERKQKTEGFIKEVMLPKGPLRDCIKYSISERLFDRFSSSGKFRRIPIREFQTFFGKEPPSELTKTPQRPSPLKFCLKAFKFLMCYNILKGYWTSKGLFIKFRDTLFVRESEGWCIFISVKIPFSTLYNNSWCFLSLP